MFINIFAKTIGFKLKGTVLVHFTFPFENEVKSGSIDFHVEPTFDAPFPKVVGLIPR